MPLYHHIPPLLPLYPLGSLLGSVIHTDSDMRLTPVPHSLKTKFRVTCLRRCIYWMVLLYHLFGGLSSGNFKQSGRLFFKIKCHITNDIRPLQCSVHICLSTWGLPKAAPTFFHYCTLMRGRSESAPTKIIHFILKIDLRRYNFPNTLHFCKSVVK